VVFAAELVHRGEAIKAEWPTFSPG
jgi:hypothetical protein